MPDLTEAIAQSAGDGVQSATVDGRTVTAVPIPDQIKAAQFLAAQAAVAGTNRNGGPRSGWNALRPARVIPPGAG